MRGMLAIVRRRGQHSHPPGASGVASAGPAMPGRLRLGSVRTISSDGVLVSELAAIGETAQNRTLETSLELTAREPRSRAPNRRRL